MNFAEMFLEGKKLTQEDLLIARGIALEMQAAYEYEGDQMVGRLIARLLEERHDEQATL